MYIYCIAPSFSQVTRERYKGACCIIRYYPCLGFCWCSIMVEEELYLVSCQTKLHLQVILTVIVYLWNRLKACRCAMQSELWQFLSTKNITCIQVFQTYFRYYSGAYRISISHKRSYKSLCYIVLRCSRNRMVCLIPPNS